MYCDLTIGWIRMTLGMAVGLGPGHIVLDEDRGPGSPWKGVQQPDRIFAIYGPRAMSIVAKGLGGSECHLVRRWASARATLFWAHFALAQSPISATAGHLFTPVIIAILAFR